MRQLFILLGLCVLAGPADAIAPRSATYYCTPDAAGGVSYDKQLQRWNAANFRPAKAFVLKLNHLSSAREKMFDGAELSAVNRFNVALTESGSSKDIPCRNMRDFSKPIEVWDEGWVRCDFNLTELRFNPENNRFLTAYLVGYVSGDDDNSDTPVIGIGVCTKLN
ncbi:hypothetical protein [Bradyrhizobium sp. CCH5-F6]|jgi:hypothetical protein|uniref:hypothetical protein n=1 Tax=Bradyrhizobium sp. CCH5-F6 TaxID=1768753 RepID=UPI000769FE82|nr:hypothetical protein [Bradyrhizobium sp. CCH5-F6]